MEEFFLLYRMKVLIIVWGTSNRGKSQSLKQLALSFPFSSIIRPWDSDNYDSYVIGAVKDSGGKDYSLRVGRTLSANSTWR